MEYLDDPFVKARMDEINAVADRLANYLIFHGAEEGMCFDTFLEIQKEEPVDWLKDRDLVFKAIVARAIAVDQGKK